jgi:hypothetical protein
MAIQASCTMAAGSAHKMLEDNMQKTILIVSNIAVTVACLGFCAVSLSDGVSSSDDRDSIAKIRARSNQAIREHDAETIVTPYDDTYQITTGSGLLFHDNPEKEKELWAEHFDELSDVLYVRTPTTIEVSTYLPRAAESGEWVGSWTSDKGPIEVGGSYSASWRKVDGQWKIQSEMFVTLYCKGDAC